MAHGVSRTQHKRASKQAQATEARVAVSAHPHRARASAKQTHLLLVVDSDRRDEARIKLVLRVSHDNTRLSRSAVPNHEQADVGGVPTLAFVALGWHAGSPCKMAKTERTRSLTEKRRAEQSTGLRAREDISQ